MINTRTKPNGARTKILLALAKNDLLTIQEIADETHLTARQVQDNGCKARSDGLIASRRDELTNLIVYEITPEGHHWLSEYGKALPKPDPVIASPAADKESLTVPCQAIEPTATAEESSAVATSESAESAPDPETVFPIDSPDPTGQEEFLYAIDNPFDKNIEIHGTHRQAAIDKALVLSRKDNAIFHVFRLVHVGTAIPLVTITAQFEEAIS